MVRTMVVMTIVSMMMIMMASMVMMAVPTVMTTTTMMLMMCFCFHRRPTPGSARVVWQEAQRHSAAATIKEDGSTCGCHPATCAPTPRLFLASGRALETAVTTLPICLRWYPRRPASTTARGANQGWREAGIGHSVGRNAHN